MVISRIWTKKMNRKSLNKNTKCRSLEQDLNDSIFIHQKLLDPTYADELYAALCNTDWEYEDGSEYACSWRYAGGIIAKILGRGEDYMSYYCNGNEGHITERIAKDLKILGWEGREIHIDDVKVEVM